MSRLKLKKHQDIWPDMQHLAHVSDSGICSGVFRHTGVMESKGTHIAHMTDERRNRYNFAKWFDDLSFQEGVRVMEVFFGAEIEYDQT